MCYSGKCPWEQHSGDCSLKSGEKCKFDFDTMEEINLYSDEFIRQWASDIRQAKIQELQTMIAGDERDMSSLFGDEMCEEARAFVIDVYVKDINRLKDKLSILTR
jgi:hypothetical protein